MKNKGQILMKESLDAVINSLPGPPEEPDWTALLSQADENNGPKKN